MRFLKAQDHQKSKRKDPCQNKANQVYDIEWLSIIAQPVAIEIHVIIALGVPRVSVTRGSNGGENN